MRDLANFLPVQDQWKWSEEDKILFEEALKLHGKAFPSIRLMIPEKSRADLVKYYYSRERLERVNRVPREILKRGL